MKIQFIKDQLTPKLLNELATVVEDPQSLISQTEEEFSDLQKFGLYPAEDCAPFVTKQGTPLYHLDNMSVIPIGQEEKWMHYGDFRFRLPGLHRGYAGGGHQGHCQDHFRRLSRGCGG